MKFLHAIWMLSLLLFSCGKSSDDPDEPPNPARQIAVSQVLLNGKEWSEQAFDISVRPTIQIRFNEPLDRSTVEGAVQFKSVDAGPAPAYTLSYQQQDSVLVVNTSADLPYFARYTLSLGNTIRSASGGRFISSVNKTLITSIDSTPKFPQLSDEALLTKIQEQTFKYFWDFGHPVSGLARERNTSGDLVTSGGSGFGIMALLVGIERQFITRAQGFQRIQTMVEFLSTRADRFHGAFPHWLDGNTGKTIPFSEKDNGADLVETSFLMTGLLSARQYFDGASAAETSLRAAITDLYEAVEWDFFLKDGGDLLYWHWSPDFGWDMNLPVRGWNECLLTYVLAAGSPTHPIPKQAYDNGWARGGAIRNGESYYSLELPLGEPFGGPLFFSHYSFLGINPNGLRDAYGDYQVQTRQHALISQRHSIENPNHYFGYSSSVWGLTASDIPDGYAASSPTNDLGVIAPAGAIASMPFTPDESMEALKFYYYVLGDKLFQDYGFVDAFSLHRYWFASSFLAIDQGPIIIMIENHRSGLLWNLFTSAPELKAGLNKLGFTAPYL